MQEKIDKDILYYYIAYKAESNEQIKMKILKRLQKLIEEKYKK